MLRGYFLAHQQYRDRDAVDEIVVEGADAARVVVHAGMVGRRRRR